MSGADFVALWYRVQPQSGTVYGERPSIYGDAAADGRVRQIAEGRGYRLQPLSIEPRTNPATLRNFERMAAAARLGGIDLYIVSGYRSADDQRTLFTERVAERFGRPPTVEEVASGAADAAINQTLDQRSAPGYSRHHSGYVLDLNLLNDSFARTPAYRWLSENNYLNARSFGFIPSYPPGIQAGPRPEPWEFSYIADPFAIRPA